MSHSQMSQSNTLASTAPALAPEDLAAWRQLLAERLDMDLPDSRTLFLRTALWGRMRDLGCATFAGYLQLVTTAPGAALEWRRLVDVLTVQETRFYRHPASFALVRKHLLRLARMGVGPVELWSVGCASGEEPWTLAMLADDVLSAVPLHFGVLGTDVSHAALAKAEQGLYLARRADELPADLRLRYLKAAADGQVRVVDQLRGRVAFSLQNLKDVAHAPQQQMHVIYCQNVLIYFPRARRGLILDALAQRLAPGGLLVMAAGESVDWRPEQLERVSSSDVVAWTRPLQGDPSDG